MANSNRKKGGQNMTKKWLACVLALCMTIALFGCKKELSTEQKIRNLERSNQELEEAARRSRQAADDAKRDIQEYQNAYAKASGKK